VRAVFFTPAARSDLHDIWDYLAARSITNADRMVERIESATLCLAEYPGMGHSRRDVSDPRCLFHVVRPYVIAFDHDDATVTILRVIHGARNFRRVFRMRK
jgi:antitoxin ParD1/3/4/toxin ParE1/3/4